MAEAAAAASDGSSAKYREREANLSTTRWTLLDADVLDAILPELERALRTREWEQVCTHAGALFRATQTRMTSYRAEHTAAQGPSGNKGATTTKTKDAEVLKTSRIYALTLLDCKILMTVAFDAIGSHRQCLQFATDTLGELLDSQLQHRVYSLRDKLLRLLVIKSLVILGRSAGGASRDELRSLTRRWKELARYGPETDIDILVVRAVEQREASKHAEETHILERLWQWWQLSRLPTVVRYVATAEAIGEAPTILTHAEAQRNNTISPIVFQDLPIGSYQFRIAAVGEGGVILSTSIPSPSVSISRIAHNNTLVALQEPVQLIDGPVTEFTLAPPTWKAPPSWRTEHQLQLSFEPPSTYRLLHFADVLLNPVVDKSLIDDMVMRNIQVYHFNAQTIGNALIHSLRMQNRSADAARVVRQLATIHAAKQE